MKRKWILILFTFGLGICWLIWGNLLRLDLPESIQPVPRSRSSVSQIRETRPIGHSSKWKVIAQRATEFDNKEAKTFVNELSPSDRISALEALAAQPGLDYGIDAQVVPLMEEIIENWSNEDFDSAWARALVTPHAGSRELMIQTLLSHLVETNPERALAIHLEQIAINPDFKSPVPCKMVNLSLNEGAASYLATLQQLPMVPHSSDITQKFAPDFDFQLAADGYAQFMIGAGDQQTPAFPRNFLCEWAKIDPEAAFAWWSRGISLPFNNISGIISGIEAGQGPGSSSEWVATKLMSPDAPREQMIREISSSFPNSLTEVSMIGNAIQDVHARDDFYTEILVFRNDNTPPKHYLWYITSLSSPEARLQVFRRLHEREMTLDLEKITIEKLQSWGITRQQLKQTLAE